VPVTLASSVALTNVQALVQIPGDHLLPLALTNWTPELGSVVLQQLAPSLWEMDFTAAVGQAFQPTQQLASLSLLAATNQSAFVPLVISAVTTNLTTSGTGVWRTLADDGRVVVLETEPLLEALPKTNGLPNLILYGINDVSYSVLFAPELPAADWQPVWVGTMSTNLWLPVDGLTNIGPTLFFRAQANP
jgi:hypothetical protein